MVWETMEVRFGVVSLATTLAWLMFGTLMVVTMAIEMRRTELMAMGACGVAVTLTVIRDNCKTRRVVRCLLRDAQPPVRSIK